MVAKKYLLSFVGRALLHETSIVVAKLYIDLLDWKLVKERVFSENLLQARTQSSAKKNYAEAVKTLKTLDLEELNILVEADYQEQAYILWLANCRCFKFIGEFAYEVLHDNFLRYRYSIDADDYHIFFTRKLDTHLELDDLTDSTKNKIQQVIFRMMREAGLIDKVNNIIPMLLTPKLDSLLAKDFYSESVYFPLASSNLAES